MKNRPIVLRNRRQKKKSADSKPINLPLFFYQFLKDHNMPNLIWNHKVGLTNAVVESLNHFYFF